MEPNPARIALIPGARSDQLAAQLLVLRQLSPTQSQQIVALVRATLETFAAHVADGHEAGALEILQVAVTSLRELERDLTATLARHQDQVRTLAPILRAVQNDGGRLPQADAPPGPPRDAHIAPSPSDNATPRDDRSAMPLADDPIQLAAATRRARLSPPAPAPSTVQPGLPPAAAGALVATLAQTLAAAVARLEETFIWAVLMPDAAALEGPPGRQPALPRAGQPPRFDGQLARFDGPPASFAAGPVQSHPTDAFHWLLEAAFTCTTQTTGRFSRAGEAGRLTPFAHASLARLLPLARALLEALAATTPGHTGLPAPAASALAANSAPAAPAANADATADVAARKAAGVLPAKAALGDVAVKDAIEPAGPKSVPETLGAAKPPTGQVNADGGVARDPRGQLAAVLDRSPSVVQLLTPILRELGLAPEANAAPALLTLTVPIPTLMPPEVLAAAIARVMVLASVIKLETESTVSILPMLPAALLAELEAAGMPPFVWPTDSPENIDAYRWLLISSQLYNAWRLAPRQPLPRCVVCGQPLRRNASYVLACPKCD